MYQFFAKRGSNSSVSRYSKQMIHNSNNMPFSPHILFYLLPDSPLINQLKKKRDIDESIRALLGEETDEGAGFKNLLRTYLSVGMMASNQAFMKNLLEIGRRKGNEWILTKDELKKKRLENIDE